MTHTKTLIESAVRGGWKPVNGEIEPHRFNGKYFQYLIEETQFGENYHEISIQEIVLDPSFWQAVSKDQGWDTKKPKTYWHKTTESVMKAGGLQVGKLKDEITILDKTECVIHDMLDHLINGGDIESFAKSLNH